MMDEIDWDCEYVEYSTVPDQTGGPFWSILNRIFIGEYLSLGMRGTADFDLSIRVPTPNNVRDGSPQATI